jgi:hypothetical protein
MKALKILKKYGYLINQYTIDLVSKDINEAIKELETLKNKSCDGCKHLPDKKKNLKYECLIEVCRSCTRNNIDNWEQK